MIIVVLLAASVAGDLEPTTTKTYDLEVPGADPIRIVEGESPWTTTPKTNFEHRAFNSRNGKGTTDDDPLHQFLSNYAEAVKRNKNKNEDEEMESVQLVEPGDSTEKAKSWGMSKYHNDDSPYDNKKGWVSMDPVPWSVSKISKWQSKYKPSTPRPWEDYDEPPVRPSWNKPTTNSYDIYYPDKLDSRPTYSKPTAIYNQKVHVDYTDRYHHKHDENCKHPQKHPYDDVGIITDGHPANFPQPYEANRRQATDIHPDNHPFSGEGEWVLLSTTKGYKYPQKRHRAMKINPESVGAHRSVRLTVLPPLKNSKVNMTTSHGGLLQVESTFQTVEQSRKQYNMKKEKLKKKKKLPVVAKPVRQVAAPTVTTTRRNTGPDSSAVLAAVGAGMIPATMAMLVPMALGGRRKREVRTSTSKYPQVTLPRNL